jgi:hypothetical protein
VRIPEYVAIAQWALLLTLGVLVTLMFRQLGRQMGVIKSAPALGPTVGTPAAGFEYMRLDTRTSELFEPAAGHAALLAFADPTCPACEELVAALNQVHADGGLAEVRPLILIAEPASYLQISEPFRDTPLPVGRLVTGSARQAYAVSATPLLVAVDGGGVVRASGPATRPADVAAFVHAAVVPRTDGATLPVLPASGRPAQDMVAASTVAATTGEQKGRHR